MRHAASMMILAILVFVPLASGFTGTSLVAETNAFARVAPVADAVRDRASQDSDAVAGDASGVTERSLRARPAAPFLNDPRAPPAMDARAQTPESSDSFDARAIADRLRNHFNALGFQAGPSDMAGMEENSSLPYSYAVGDVDGDGNDDLVLDLYCVDWDACRLAGGYITNTIPYARLDGEVRCGWPHQLVAVSGLNKSKLWQKPLSVTRVDAVTGPLGYADAGVTCYVEFVVGTLPRVDTGSDLIIYRYGVTRVAGQTESPGATVLPSEGRSEQRIGGQLLVSHNIYRLDTRTANVTWTFGRDGHWITTDLFFGATDQPGAFVVDAENVLLHPIIQVAPPRGVALVPRDLEPSIIIQGIGYRYTFANHAPSPGKTTVDSVADDYQPREWAARLDPETGIPEWESRTFEPSAGKSVWPDPLMFSPEPGFYSYPLQLYYPTFGGGLGPFRYEIDRTSQNTASYWDGMPCCFDNTGDGVSDLVYTTLEWDAVPVTGSAVESSAEIHLVLFDGATGERVWDQVLEPAGPKFLSEESSWFGGPGMRLSRSLVGDVDGDGAADLLIHIEYLAEQYAHIATVRSGRTGEELWRIDSPRQVATFAIGDADGDGGNEIAVIEWHAWEYPRETFYDFMNVSRTTVTVHSGADGSRLWRTPTFNAPIDYAYTLTLLAAGGFPDFDADGVAEIPVDDSLQLTDLTVVHQLRFLSGRTGLAVSNLTLVGTFSLGVRVDDLTGDGVDEVLFLSGDIMDLWVTAHDGGRDQALWSRRLMTLRIADYTMAVPRLRAHSLAVADGGSPQTLLNAHVDVLSLGGWRVTSSTYPQVGMFAPSGGLGWGHPQFEEVDVSAVTRGATPAGTAFELALAEVASASIVASAKSLAVAVGPGVSAFSIATLAGYFLTSRRWRT